MSIYNTHSDNLENRINRTLINQTVSFPFVACNTCPDNKECDFTECMNEQAIEEQKKSGKKKAPIGALTIKRIKAMDAEENPLHHI